MAKQDGGVPAWVWVGCGCLLCIVLLIGGVAAAGFLGFGMLKKTVEDMADPAARQAKVEELLGAENGLPDGYHAHSTLTIPFAFKLASISDGPEPQAAGEDASFEQKAEIMVETMPRLDNLGEHTFIYLQARGMADEQRVHEILGGERVGGTTNIDLNLHFDADEDLGSGSLEAAGTTVDWWAERGTLRTMTGPTEAQWVSLRFGCGDPPRGAVWIEHPPLEGSLAEPTRLTAFLDHFSPCG